jgi:hypothetical protein
MALPKVDAAGAGGVVITNRFPSPKHFLLPRSHLCFWEILDFRISEPQSFISISSFLHSLEGTYSPQTQIAG